MGATIVSSLPNFHVYQYATGISVAHALVNGVLFGKDGATDDDLNVLRVGGSLDPLAALKEAGRDLSTPELVEETFDVLAGLVDRLGSLLDVQ